MSNLKKIPMFQLIAKPMDKEAEALPKFKWALDYVGTRHQLGGTPKFIQQETWPKCPSCSEPMSFYGQLDSINDEFQIADCGMIYIFICFDCNETISIVQSY
jgi:hypothetical protein